jgi:hypothetical protein
MDENNYQQVINIPKPKKLGGRSGKGFMPGKSGNPLGHPKGVPNFAHRYKKLCEKMLTLPVPLSMVNGKRGFALGQIAGIEHGDKFSNGECVAAATIFAAMNGESWAIQQLAGKPDQSLEIKNISDAIQIAINTNAENIPEPSQDYSDGGADGNNNGSEQGS